MEVYIIMEAYDYQAANKMQQVGNVKLSRVEKYRRKRIARKRYFVALSMLAVLLAAGILAVDCSTNYLVSGRKGVAFASLDNRGDSLEITVMNHKFHINTKYISRDLQALKKKIDGIMKGVDPEKTP